MQSFAMPHHRSNASAQFASYHSQAVHPERAFKGSPRPAKYSIVFLPGIAGWLRAAGHGSNAHLSAGPQTRGLWSATILRPILLFLILVVLSATTTLAQTKVPSRERLNSGTVSIITGQPHYLSSRLASDLSAVLDEGDNLRVLAIAGRGAISDLIDTLLLRGIDIAIVPADVVDYVDKNKMLPAMTRKLRVVSRLYNKIAHLVAGPGIQSLDDLRGKKINIVSRYHGSYVVAENALKQANIEFEPVYLDQRLALQRVENGAIAATLIMSGRPNPLLDEFRGRRLRLIDLPFTPQLPDAYFPIELKSNDYPGLILPGQTIRTIATPSIMMVYDFPEKSPRREKVTRFIDAFLARLPDLQQSPRHPRWRDVNLGAAIAGLRRYETVVQWLSTNKPEPVAARRPNQKGRRSVQELFRAFIAAESAKGGAEQLLRLEKPELFARFRAWQKQQRESPAPTVQTASKSKPSLRALFREFIDAEATRIGRDNVLALTKKELFDRFLEWRKQAGGQ